MKMTLVQAYRIIYVSLWTLDTLDIDLTVQDFKARNLLDDNSPSSSLLYNQTAAPDAIQQLRDIHSVRDAICYQIVALAECCRDARCLYELHQEIVAPLTRDDGHKVSAKDKERLRALGYNPADYSSAYAELNRLARQNPGIAVASLNSLRTKLAHCSVLPPASYQEVWDYVNGKFSIYAAAIEIELGGDKDFKKLDLPEARKDKRKRLKQEAQQASASLTRSQVLDHFNKD